MKEGQSLKMLESTLLSLHNDIASVYFGRARGERAKGGVARGAGRWWRGVKKGEVYGGMTNGGGWGVGGGGKGKERWKRGDD